jgi:hypothetical protein
VAAKSPTGFTLDRTVTASAEKDSVKVKITAAKIMAELITKVFLCILLQPPIVQPFPTPNSIELVNLIPSLRTIRSKSRTICKNQTMCQVPS